MSETKNSPEPWRDDDPGAQRFIEVCDARGRTVGVLARGPARQRLVACVNACASIPTAALEAGALAKALDRLSAFASSQEFGGICQDCGFAPLRWGEEHASDCVTAAVLRALGRLP